MTPDHPPPGLGPLFATDLFVPTYRPIQATNWRLTLAPMVLTKGYWSPARLVTNMAALIRQEADGRITTWMSMTPMEMESQEIGVRHCRGHVLVYGLGMGWAAVNAALRAEVTAVTVVEYDPAVIGMIDTLGILDQLPDSAREKITIRQGDAHSYVPDRPVDTLMADIWQPLYGRGRVGEVRGMQANCRAAEVYYFGQEIEIAMYAREAGLDLDADGIARVVADMGLPLIGPGLPDYPERVRAAAGQWWKGD
ncbi:MAG: hypothetical protein RLY86_4232 [Pseudomonadota bacterium]|jgi:hypothetical protein